MTKKELISGKKADELNRQTGAVLADCCNLINSLKDVTLPDLSDEGLIRIELPGFGQVHISLVRITHENLFIQTKETDLKYPFVRLTLTRENGAVSGCQNPEWFLPPKREITEEDLVNPRRWAEFLRDDERLMVTKFIHRTLTYFANSQSNGERIKTG